MSVENIELTKDQLVIVQDLVSKERRRIVDELNETQRNKLIYNIYDPKFGGNYYNKLKKECDILTQLNEEMKTKMNRL
ncbi:MAG: hypothetical protein ACR2M6_00270 [Vampirovibrionia bacterium]